jgi:hypothetical protein
VGRRKGTVKGVDGVEYKTWINISKELSFSFLNDHQDNNTINSRRRNKTTIQSIAEGAQSPSRLSRAVGAARAALASAVGTPAGAGRTQEQEQTQGAERRAELGAGASPARSLLNGYGLLQFTQTRKKIRVVG